MCIDRTPGACEGAATRASQAKERWRPHPRGCASKSNRYSDRVVGRPPASWSVNSGSGSGRPTTWSSQASRSAGLIAGVAGTDAGPPWAGAATADRRPRTGDDPDPGPGALSGPVTAGTGTCTSTASNDATAPWLARFLVVSKQGFPSTLTPSRSSDARVVKPFSPADSVTRIGGTPSRWISRLMTSTARWGRRATAAIAVPRRSLHPS